jgi:hypothetical protein
MTLFAEIIAFFDDPLSYEWRIIYTCIATILINIPFGFLRGGVDKFSIWWFLFIHAPIPLVIIIRKFHGLDLTLALAPFLLGSFFIGQYLGRKVYRKVPVFRR